MPFSTHALEQATERAKHAQEVYDKADGLVSRTEKRVAELAGQVATASNNYIEAREARAAARQMLLLAQDEVKDLESLRDK